MSQWNESAPVSENAHHQVYLRDETIKQCEEENSVSKTGLKECETDCFKKLKDFETKILSQTSLCSNELVREINDIRACFNHEWQKAASERQNLEANMMLMTSQIDYWKSEAEHIMTELSYLKGQDENETILETSANGTRPNAKLVEVETEELEKKNGMMSKVVRSEEEEIKHLKSVVSDLLHGLNENKHEYEQIVSAMNKKQKDFMDMINNINAEFSAVVNKKNHEIKGLVDYINIHAKRFGSRSQRVDQILTNLELCQIDDDTFCVERLSCLERYPSLTNIDQIRPCTEKKSRKSYVLPIRREEPADDTATDEESRHDVVTSKTSGTAKTA